MSLVWISSKNEKLIIECLGIFKDFAKLYRRCMYVSFCKRKFTLSESSGHANLNLARGMLLCLQFLRYISYLSQMSSSFCAFVEDTPVFEIYAV